MKSCHPVIEISAPSTVQVGFPVYAINLAGSNERWETLKASVGQNAPGMMLHRVEAVDGRLPEHAQREHADLPLFTKRCGRTMLPGEYGCYRSHIRALEAFLASGAMLALITEDDIAFAPDTEVRLRAIVKAHPSLEILKVMNHRNTTFLTLGTTSEGDEVGVTWHGPQGSSAGYLVSREAARKLLERASVMSLPIDVALERSWDHGAVVLATRSNVLEFSPHSRRSAISGSGYRSTKFPWYRRIPTAIFRTIDHIQRTTFAITTRLRNDKILSA